MAPLIVLIVTFVITYFINKYGFNGKFNLAAVGCLAMAVMLVFTGIAHFFKTEAMIEMLPDFLLWKEEVVYLTGLIEVLSGIGLLLSGSRKYVSVLLIIFLLGVLPANIIGSMKELDFGGMSMGPNYLYFRIPLQLFFIGWIYYFGIRQK